MTARTRAEASRHLRMGFLLVWGKWNYSTIALVEVRSHLLQNANQLFLFLGGEAANQVLFQAEKRLVERGQDSQRLVGDRHVDDAAVLGRALTADEPGGFETIDQPGDTGDDLDHPAGDLEHRHRLAL